MGRRKRPNNKKSGDSGTPTPPPENDRVDAEEVEETPENSTSATPVPAAEAHPTDTPAAAAVPETPHVNEPAQETSAPAPAPAPEPQPAAVKEPEATPEPTPEPTQTEANSEVVSAPAPQPAPQEPLNEAPSQPPTTTAAAPAAAVDGVAALNAYALQNAESGEAAEIAPAPAEATAETAQLLASSDDGPVSPPRTSSKRVAFITPVVSSITSISDVDAPREANCIESRCAACSVM